MGSKQEVKQEVLNCLDLILAKEGGLDFIGPFFLGEKDTRVVFFKILIWTTCPLKLLTRWMVAKLYNRLKVTCTSAPFRDLETFLVGTRISDLSYTSSGMRSKLFKRIEIESCMSPLIGYCADIDAGPIGISRFDTEMG